VKTRYRFLPAVLAAGLLCGCGEQRTAESASTANSPVEVDVFVVSGASSSYVASSTLTVEHEADLLTEEPARLMNVQADQGQRVRRGQVLAQLDDSDVRKQFEGDRAAMQSAEVQSRESVVIRQAAEVELQRQGELRKEGLGSQREYDRARFNLDAMRQEVDKYAFDLERAKARAAADEIRLGRMQIRAPFDGIVSRRYARVGQSLLKDDKVLRLTELRPLLVRFTVPEALRRAVGAGATVEVVPADQAAAPARARVMRTGYVVDAASGSVECVARLVDPVPATLVPGMGVEVKVAGAAATASSGALWIPRAAVRRGADGNADVFVLKADRLQRRSVKLGREAEATVQVLSGLATGDRIVAQTRDGLQDGMAVRARP
jgi:membrane fusion protein (multidrug efflux system)